ncbi:MAG TPA: AAA-like domain-containing protein, partial [Gammaproteobacteria bacterium]|nr:AAA-like domain-containing protein [Gammaproteobacteria bacterium]
DRSCYIERSADQHLIDAVVGQRFAYLLAPRGSGKTSLMLRVSALLRAETQFTAVVDLRQIAAHGEGADPSRWFYGVARRICRELRLKFDLQTWWQERSALNAEQRFAEFFSDIVLTHTAEPVTVFFDEVEHVSELAFASDFFEVIRNCYALRASEPDYARLNFVVLGAGSHTQLCPDAAISPFVIGEEIPLHDFSLEQTYRLEPGFDVGTQAALGLIERIYSWTSGQPYLTQKLARAVARRGGRLEDVERCAQELFLSTNAARAEPQLSHVGAELTRRGPVMRAGLLTLRRLVYAKPVPFDPASKAHERLVATGVARRGDDGELEITNRVYARVFNERWVRAAMPFNWRGLGVAAGIAALLMFVPYWYVNHLPQPFIQALTTPELEFETMQIAYERLHRLPGFAATADDLFADVLAQRARSMNELDDVIANDALVRSLQGRDALADRLFAEFWLRRSREAAHAESRDAALLYATAAWQGSPQAATRAIEELRSTDYARLLDTVHLGETPAYWTPAGDHSAVTIVDTDNTARVVQVLPDGPRSATERHVLTALRHTAFVREQSVDSAGSAGGFALRIVADHPQPEELTVTLASPSGAATTVALGEAFREGDGFVLDTEMLDVLADEQRQGVWRLTIVDTAAGNAGVLHSWSLEFDSVTDTWLGAPDAGVAIPDPIRTSEVTIDLSLDGTIAVAEPVLSASSTSLGIWDVRTGALLHDLRLDRELHSFELTADGAHLLVVAGNELLIWSVREGAEVARIATQTQFVLPPALSSDGGYVAIAEQVDEAEPLFSLIRIADAALVASITGSAAISGWVLGPEARYLALLDATRAISVIEPRRGAAVARIELDRPPARVVAGAHGELLITVDAAGAVHVWRFTAAEEGISLADNWLLGSTNQARSVSVSPDATTLAYAARAGDVVVHDLARRRAALVLRPGISTSGVATHLADDGTTLLTLTGNVLRAWNLAERRLGAPPTTQLTALTIGREGRLAALGFSGGFVRAASLTDPEALAVDREVIDYIGHRGPVTALSMNVEQNLVASGGQDGTARLWNLATLSPGDISLNHAEDPVAALSLSSDARWLLVGGVDAASLWALPGGEERARYTVNGIAQAVAFSSRSQSFAIGDSTGNVIVAQPGQDEPGLAVRAESAIAALAFAPGADYVASGDVLGNLRFLSLRSGVAAPAAYRFREPIRWLAFAGSDDRLIVQTHQWLHEVRPGEPTSIAHTRLLPVGVEAGAAPTGAGGWRLLGSLLHGAVEIAEIDFAEPEFDAVGRGESSAAADLGAVRDWGRVLGLELDETGMAIPVMR